MKCPNCGIEIENDEASFCDKCGFALYGPRNVNINDLYKDKNENEKIEKITGFKIQDFKELPTSEGVSILNNKLNSKKGFKDSKTDFIKFIKDNKIKVTIISLASLCAILLIILIIVIATSGCEEKKCEVIKDNSNKTNYITNSEYKLLLPDGFKYMEEGTTFVLSNDTYTALFYGLTGGSLDLSTSARVKKVYTDSGNIPTEVSESIVDNRKLFLIKYNRDGIYYCDFYYQYNSEKIIYGVVSAGAVNIDLFDDNMKKIVASLAINEQTSSINKPASGVDYGSIIGQIFL